MITDPIVLILLAILLILYIIGTIQDIKYRQTYHLSILMSVLIVVGIVTNIVVNEFTEIILSYLICVGLFFLARVVNILRINHNKHRIFGGSDLNLYVVSVMVYPLFCGAIWTSLIIPSLAFIVLSLFSFSKKFSKDCKKRGIPFIPFLGIGTFAPILIEIAICLIY